MSNWSKYCVRFGPQKYIIRLRMISNCCIGPINEVNIKNNECFPFIKQFISNRFFLARPGQGYLLLLLLLFITFVYGTF